MKIRCRNLGFLGFPNYKVGENGSVWSRWGKRGTLAPWRKLKLRVYPNTGRVYIDLFRGRKSGHGRGIGTRFLVHVLVLTAFVGPRPEGQQCRHFPDANPENNWITNLQWGTQSENEKDKKFHETSNDGERNGRAKLSNHQARKVCRLYSTGDYKQKELAEMFGVTQGNISMITTGYSRQKAIA